MGSTPRLVCALLLSCLVLTGSLAALAAQAPLVRNGDFSEDLNHWRLVSGFEHWYPLCTEGDGNVCVSIETPEYCNGPVIAQSLNIIDVADKQFTASIDLKQTYQYTEGDAEVYIQYVDTSDHVQSVRALTSSGGTFDTETWTTVTGSVTLPSDARKVTGISVNSTGWAHYYVDNVVLSATGVTQEAVPEITGISPESGPYGTTLTVSGTGFGIMSTGCQVLIAGSPDGVSIQEWSDTSIQVTVSDPVATGKVEVVADFVVAEGDFTYTVTSPYYTISVPDSVREAYQGEIVRYCVWVNTFNGYNSPGGISFSLVGAPPGVESFAPAQVHGAGGTELTIDTSTLAPGSYLLEVDASDGASAARRAYVSLDVVTVTGIQWWGYNPGTGFYEQVTEISATQQGYLSLWCEVTDSKGNVHMPKFLSVTSSDPAKLLAFPESWGDYGYYAMENGDASFTASTPDGHSAAVTVHIDFPSYPSCTSISVTPSPVTNDGLTDITFTATSTSAYMNAGWYLDGFNVTDMQWSPDGYTVTYHGALTEGTSPGDYMFFSGYSPYSYPFRPAILTVVNDPNRGQIKGRIYNLGESVPQSKPVGGTFELYDTSGEKVLEREINNWSDEYVISYVQPGTYTARFVPVWWSNLGAQWYADAEYRENAVQFEVVAGRTTDDINFFLMPAKLHVLWTSPADGATCAPTSLPIIAAFDKELASKSVNESTFFLQDSEGNVVPGEVGYGGGVVVNSELGEGYLVTFTPEYPLEPNATYTATLTTGIYDQNGVSLEADYVWTFTTGRNLIADLKGIPDGETVELNHKILYYVMGDFGYIEEPDRSAGIRIQGLYGEDPLDVPIYLCGTKRTTEDGEPYIDLEDYWFDYDFTWIAPFGANSRAVRTSLISGLKVRVWGTVLSVDPETPSYVISESNNPDDALLVYGDCPVDPGEFTCVDGAAGGGASRVIYATLGMPE